MGVDGRDSGFLVVGVVRAEFGEGGRAWWACASAVVCAGLVERLAQLAGGRKRSPTDEAVLKAPDD
jgi:hypothetical protein